VGSGEIVIPISRFVQPQKKQTSSQNEVDQLLGRGLTRVCLSLGARCFSEHYAHIKEEYESEKENQMEQTSGNFYGTNECKLYYKAWLPEESPKATLAIVHGAGEHIDRYENLVK
jgi:hypothetical protein